MTVNEIHCRIIKQPSSITMKKTKALLLFSGGLDSMLSAKVLQKQGVEVVGLTLVSYFFGDGQAVNSAKKVGIDLISHDFSKKHLAVVKKPKHGFGKAANPCIDCHALMFCEAGEIAKTPEELVRSSVPLYKRGKIRGGFDIVATGEVLGQRPFSQNKGALLKVEKEAGLEGRILRPLCALNLPETVYEKEGLVDREKLLDIVGRSRKKQLQLAKEFGIEEFPTPAGGCLLTEQEFSQKLFDLLENVKNPKPSDFELIKIGRHYWKGVHVVLGRNKEENELIEKLAEKNDVVLKRKDAPGPTALIRGELADDDIILEFVKKEILNRSAKRGTTNNWSIRLKK